MMQVKLLRAIQERAIRPVGSHEELTVDVRILCATHKNLAESVKQGAFREDLFYRLNVIELKVPPLRERTEDIPQLAEHILRQLAEKNGIQVPSLAKDAMVALQQYRFPGNVRELENILERALTWNDDGEISAEDLLLPELEQSKEIHIPQITVLPTTDLGSQLEDQERQLITEALESTRWNKTAAAKKLGITFRALRYKLKKLNLK